MKQACSVNIIKGVSMKKTVFVVALAAVLVFAFATAAFATSAKTWNYSTDYYTWGTTPNSGNGGTPTLANLGDNAANPGAHGNYLSTTAKCGICHSVHRAKGDGVKLLNTADRSCLGCHRTGTATATDVRVAWGFGSGPHGSTTVMTGGTGTNPTGSTCLNRACHIGNPHGANGSSYKVVAQKLLSPATDAALAAAVANPVASGISADKLNAVEATTKEWKSTVRTGYNCNQSGCHVQTLLAVVEKGWSETRYDTYEATHGYADKTGHLGIAGTTGVAFAPVESCVSCHDQEDPATVNGNDSTVSGYTFPHGQVATWQQPGQVVTGATYADSTEGPATAGPRAWLWMNIGEYVGATKTPMTTSNMKAYDGACIKCHRADATTGVGLTF